MLEALRKIPYDVGNPEKDIYIMLEPLREIHRLRKHVCEKACANRASNKHFSSKPNTTKHTILPAKHMASSSQVTPCNPSKTIASWLQIAMLAPN